MPGQVLLQLALGPEAVAAEGATVGPAPGLGPVGFQLFLGLESFAALVALEEALGRVLRQAAERWGNLSHGFRIWNLPFALVPRLRAHFFVVEEDGRGTALLPTVEARDEFSKRGVWTDFLLSSSFPRQRLNDVTS